MSQGQVGVFTVRALLSRAATRFLLSEPLPSKAVAWPAALS